MTLTRDTKLIDVLQEKLASLGDPKMTVDRNGDRHRTNDPVQPFLQRCAGLDRSHLTETVYVEADEFNGAIGMTRAEERVPMAGIAGIVLQMEPEAALQAYDEIAETGTRPTMTEIAAKLLGLAESTANALLAGPSWAGDRAGWIRPGDAAEATRKAAGKAAAKDVWSHLNRQALIRLDKGFGTEAHAYARRAKAAGEKKCFDPENHEDRKSWMEQEFPRTRVAESAAVDATALIASGASIDGDAKIQRLARVEERVHVGAGAVIERSATLHRGCYVSEDAQIGAHASVGREVMVWKEVKVGERAAIEQRAELRIEGKVEAGARVGAASLIGEKATVGKEATIGSDTTIERQATIGAGVTVGRCCRIGKDAKISNAEIVDYTMIPDGAEIGNTADAEAYAIEYTHE